MADELYDFLFPKSTQGTVVQETQGIDSLIEQEAAKYGIDDSLLKALVNQETGGIEAPEKAISPKGAVGVMQIMPDTGRRIAQQLGEEFTLEKLKDPVTNIKWGTFLFAQNKERFGSDALALAAYHGGPGAILPDGNINPKSNDGIINTTDYVKSILTKAQNIPQQKPAQQKQYERDELSDFLGIRLFTKEELEAQRKPKEPPVSEKPTTPIGSTVSTTGVELGKPLIPISKTPEELFAGSEGKQVELGPMKEQEPISQESLTGFAPSETTRVPVADVEHKRSFIGEIPEKEPEKTGFTESLVRSAGAGTGELALNIARIPQTAAEIYIGLNNLFNKGVNKIIEVSTLGKIKDAIPTAPYEIIPDIIKLDEKAWDVKAVKKFIKNQKEAIAEATNGKGVVDNLVEGNFSEAGKSLGIQVAAQIPLVASMFVGGLAGASSKVLGGMAGATTASQQMDKYWEDVENGITNQSPDMAAVNALVNGVVEGLGENLGTGKIITESIEKLTKAGGEKLAKETVGKIVGGYLGKVLQSAGQEATEETVVNFTQTVSDKLFGSKPDATFMDAVKAGIEGGIVGFFSSATTTGQLSGIAESVGKMTPEKGEGLEVPETDLLPKPLEQQEKVELPEKEEVVAPKEEVVTEKTKSIIEESEKAKEELTKALGKEKSVSKKSVETGVESEIKQLQAIREDFKSTGLPETKKSFQSYWESVTGEKLSREDAGEKLKQVMGSVVEETDFLPAKKTTKKQHPEKAKEEPTIPEKKVAEEKLVETKEEVPKESTVDKIRAIENAPIEGKASGIKKYMNLKKAVVELNKELSENERIEPKGDYKTLKANYEKGISKLEEISEPVVEDVGKKKKPYEMTKDEFNKTLRTEKAKDVFGDITHKNLVIEAISQGKTIPQEVLKDYPGIIKEGLDAKKNAEEFNKAKKAQLETEQKVVKEAKKKEVEKQIEKEETKFDKLITTPLPQLIKESGYKTNRLGVHDLIKYDQEQAIKKAIKEGKTISPEVLKDYPEFKKKETPKKGEVKPLEKTAKIFSGNEKKIVDIPVGATVYSTESKESIGRKKYTVVGNRVDEKGNQQVLLNDGKQTIAKDVYSGSPLFVESNLQEKPKTTEKKLSPIREKVTPGTLKTYDNTIKKALKGNKKAQKYLSSVVLRKGNKNLRKIFEEEQGVLIPEDSGPVRDKVIESWAEGEIGPVEKKVKFSEAIPEKEGATFKHEGYEYKFIKGTWNFKRNGNWYPAGNPAFNKVIEGYYNKIYPPKKETRNIDIALEAEAKKYESAEEFIKSKKIVYHGSTVPVKKFSALRGGSLGVFYFTDDLSVAEKYSKTSTPYDTKENIKEAKKTKGYNPSVIEAYVDIKKPLTENNDIFDLFSTNELIEKLEEYNSDFEDADFWNEKQKKDEINGFLDSTSVEHTNKSLPDNLRRIFGYFEDLSDIKDIPSFLAEKKGYDGVIYDDLESGGKTIVPFNKNQIKTKKDLIKIWEKANTKTVEKTKPSEAIPEALVKSLGEKPNKLDIAEETKKPSKTIPDEKGKNKFAEEILNGSDKTNEQGRLESVLDTARNSKARDPNIKNKQAKAISAIEKQIQHNPSKKNLRSEWLNSKEYQYFKWVDIATPIIKMRHVLEKAGVESKKLLDSFDYAIDRVRGSGTEIQRYIKDNFEPIFEDLKKLSSKQKGIVARSLSQYLIAKRTQWLYNNKDKYKDVGISIDKANTIVDYVENGDNPDSDIILEMARRLWNYNKNLVKIKYDNGVIDKDLLDNLKEPYYVPFYRDVESGFQPKVPQKLTFTSTSTGIKRIKGSKTGRKIIDPIQLIIASTGETITNANRAIVAQNITKIAEEHPDVFDGLVTKYIESPRRVGSIEHRAQVDELLRKQLTEFASKIGIDTKIKFKLGKKRLGVFDEFDQEIRLLYGATESTFAHELGHAIDSKYGWFSQLFSNKEYSEELNSIADSRYENVEVPLKYVRYVRQRDEKIAEFIALYLTNRPMLKEIAPKLFNEFENRIKNNELKDLINIKPSNVKKMETYHEPNYVLTNSIPNDMDVISLRKNGQLVHYRVPIEMAMAVKNMEPQQMSTLFRFMFSIPTKILRFGAVSGNPDFFIPNITRDQIDAAFNAKTIPFVDWFIGAKHFIFNTDLLKAYDKYGGGMDSPESGVTGAKKGYGEVIYGSKKGKFLDPFYWVNNGILTGSKELVSWGVSLPFRPIIYMAELSEMGTRIGVFRRTLKAQGIDINNLKAKDTEFAIKQSVHAAKQSTLDFQRFGYSGKIPNEIIPFLNASIQGVDRFTRSWAVPISKGKVPIRPLVYTGVLYSMAMALTAWNMFRDEEEYKKISSREKSNNWIFMTGDGEYFKMAKGHIAKLIVNPGQMVVESILGVGQKDGWGITVDIFSNLSPIEMGSMPVVIKLLLEPIANYDFYWKNKIEKDANKTWPKGLRYKKSTSETLKTIGKALNISPMMMQHEVNVALGGSGRNILWLTDWILGYSGLQKPPHFEASNAIVIRRFKGKVEDWKSDTNSMLREVNKRINEIKRGGKGSRIKTLRQQGASEKEIWDAIRASKKEMAQLIAKRRELLNANTKLNTLSTITSQKGIKFK